MWKWLIAFVLLVILLIPTPVLADTSAEVTVTATGYIVEAPGGFTLTYISDYEVGISWIKGLDAENTMIRAAYGRLPESRTDGYLVYYGDLEATSDTAVSLDETATPVYYRAWSETAGGVWEETGVSDFIEGVGMTLIAFVFLAVSLTIATFALKSGRTILAFASAGAWMVLGVYNYTRFVDLWDIYYALFWLSMGMVFVCVLVPAILREKKEGDISVEDIDEIDRPLYESYEADEKDKKYLDKISGKSRRKSKKGLSRFARTGKE